MSNRIILPLNIVLLLATFAPSAMAEVINVPCISSQGSAGGWWYPTVKKEHYPLILIKAQVWTRGIERHPLYSSNIPGSTPPIKLASCAIVPADKEAWAQEAISITQEGFE